ncbi:hypothetical protein [Streptomyces noursei]|uniref:hypothetical protein n=1 Tax=Streptomyces noursei TaxID=1971 RepID=UPI0037F40DCA
MSTPQKSSWSWRILGVGVTCTALIGLAALPASAMTGDRVLRDCASGFGKCTFNGPYRHESEGPAIGKAYLGGFHQVSDTMWNCTTSPAKQTLTWSDTVGSTDSFDVSIKAGGKIAGVVEASVEAKYGHTWMTQHSDSASLEMTVKPGEVGWISRAQVMRELTGYWQTHYDNPQDGHYYWYLGPDTITSPAPNDTEGVKNSVVLKTRPMTDAEKNSCQVHNAGVFLSKKKVEQPQQRKAPHAPPQAVPGKDDTGAADERQQKGN